MLETTGKMIQKRQNGSQQMSWRLSKTSRDFMSRTNSVRSLFCCLLVLVGVVAAKDQLTGNGPLEPLLVNQKYPTGLTEKELEALSLDDPKLRIAYYFLIKYAHGGAKIVDDRTPEPVAALNDLTMRGALLHRSCLTSWQRIRLPIWNTSSH